ncbi:MAG: hypothetical protein JW820_12040 [Spirochaetales bacterium]|nr:hypothetical protein [Spirochaetales bacterium]
MNRNVLIAGALLVLGASLFSGCALGYQDEVELAKAVMQSVEGSSPTDSYKSASARGVLLPDPPAGLLVWLVECDELPPPEDGTWSCTLEVTLTDFVPPGHEGSLVSGTLTSTLVITFVKGTPTTLSMSFDGEWKVAGECEGTYLLDAVLVYDFGKGEYSYVGTVQIDDYLYTFKG